jgi:hypothetical protein
MDRPIRFTGNPWPPPEQLLRPCAVVGLDLGKLSDFTALVLLEWDWPWRPGRLWRADYRITTLKRWQLGTPYLDIVDQVTRFIGTLPERAWPLLVLDSTGVGEAVTEAAVRQMREAKTRGGYVAITITGGNVVTPRENARFNVSKKQLVSHLQVVMGSRRLHVSQELEEARTLLRELEKFQVKITDAGNEWKSSAASAGTQRSPRTSFKCSCSDEIGMKPTVFA